MDDVRVGRALRAVRHRRRLRLRDVSSLAGISVSALSRIERGLVDGISLRTLRRVAAQVDLRLDVVVRSIGGEIDWLLDRAHARLGEAVTRWLVALGWEVRPEVSFSRWGERGVIDLLAWHPASGALLVIELKTAIVDLQQLLGSLDRKVRLAPELIRESGWRPSFVGAAVIVLDGRSNRRRVQEHAALVRAALPADGRQLRPWVHAPAGPIRALAFWPKFPEAPRTSCRGTKRVRV
jgi:transcriptional regulator with XRE-family HTH domain